VLAAAYKEGYTIEKLYELTKIDKWFLSRMKCIMDYALMLKSYREKAEVIMMFSIVNLSEQTNSHLNVEGTMSYSGKYFWNIYLTNQNMKDKKGLGISQIFTCGQTEILVTAWSDLYRCTCILSTRVCVTTIDFQTESEP